MIEQLKKGFNRVFSEDEQHDVVESVRFFFSPGRVNLIGEHTDYNGGHVFPCALTMGTYGAVRKNSLGVLRLYSENFPEDGLKVIPMDEYRYCLKQGWTNYVLGVIAEIQAMGYHLDSGMDFYINGDIPNGAGLSSSASIEMLTAVVVDKFFNFGISRVDLIKCCQRAENHFVGVNCGIMDQFAIGMGLADHAMLLDTNTLNYQQIALSLSQENLGILIGNTNKKRELADTKYNERLGECREALKVLQNHSTINNLCDLDVESFNRIQSFLKDPVQRRRARHAISENQRTLNAVKVLQDNDLKGFGELMKASHDSLRDDYEVSCRELDIMVDLLNDQADVLGARMTGAGFGGCTVSIVRQDAIPSLINKIGPTYEAQTGYRADFYVASIGEGTKEIKEEME